MALVNVDLASITTDGSVDLSTPDKSYHWTGQAHGTTHVINDLTQRPRYILEMAVAGSSGQWIRAYDVDTLLGMYAGQWSGGYQPPSTGSCSTIISNVSDTGFTFVQDIQTTCEIWLVVYY